MAKFKIEKITEADDPMRCQGVAANGQCHNKALVLDGFCPIHGGNHAIARQDKEKKRLYNLSKYRQRLSELDSPNQDVKNLREEIGILRIVMEEVVNQCEGPVDILANAPKISDLAVKIGKLVNSCHGIEKSLGQYLDKSVMIQIAQEIVAAIGNHVKEPATLDLVIEDIAGIMERLDEED